MIINLPKPQQSHKTVMKMAAQTTRVPQKTKERP